MSIDLNSIARPNSVSIFVGGVAGAAIAQAFLLNNTAISAPGRVRLDLTKNVGITRQATPARSPVETAVVDNIRLEPRGLTVSGTLSANPLGPVNVPLGAFGSAFRRDLKELKKLQQIQDQREPVIVVTYSETFSSMSMSIDEVHTGDNKVDLSLTFEEVRIVSPITTAGALDFDALGVGAGTSQAAGPTSPSTVTAPSGVAGGLG